jgi:hypothetical protein
VNSYIDALYDSPMGKLRFFQDGVYELNSGGIVKKGRYAFFLIGSQEMLELRPDQSSLPRPENGAPAARAIYRVEAAPPDEEDQEPRKTLSLSRVRLGTMGIQDLHEPVISLTVSEG